VLNTFSFSGGFSVYAARGGARVVTDLDISEHALAAAGRNFKLNQTDSTVARALHELVQANAFEWLAGNSRRKFDLVVLDPPSLAKREAERAGAIRAYGKLAESGLKHRRPGGILVACSCSAHVTAEEFFSAVRQSAAKSGRKFVELRTTRHAPDHPATFAEAEYLKAIYLRLS
jgi:23S rRNA (cytosine1962-C5)-methyltransferase